LKGSENYKIKFLKEYQPPNADKP